METDVEVLSQQIGTGIVIEIMTGRGSNIQNEIVIVKGLVIGVAEKGWKTEEDQIGSTTVRGTEEKEGGIDTKNLREGQFLLSAAVKDGHPGTPLPILEDYVDKCLNPEF